MVSGSTHLHLAYNFHCRVLWFLVTVSLQLNLAQLSAHVSFVHVSHCKLHVHWQAMVRQPNVQPGAVQAAMEPCWSDFSC